MVGMIFVDGQPVEQTRSATNAESIIAWVRNWLKQANEKRVQVDFDSRQESP
jgi:thioredoxin-like negative regulator of GroEL